MACVLSVIRELKTLGTKAIKAKTNICPRVTARGRGKTHWRLSQAVTMDLAGTSQ